MISSVCKPTIKTNKYFEEELSRYRTTGCSIDMLLGPPPKKQTFISSRYSYKNTGARLNNHNLSTCATLEPMDPWLVSPSGKSANNAWIGFPSSFTCGDHGDHMSKPPTGFFWAPPQKKNSAKLGEIATKFCKQ